MTHRRVPDPDHLSFVVTTRNLRPVSPPTWFTTGRSGKRAEDSPYRGVLRVRGALVECGHHHSRPASARLCAKKLRKWLLRSGVSEHLIEDVEDWRTDVRTDVDIDAPSTSVRAMLGGAIESSRRRH